MSIGRILKERILTRWRPEDWSAFSLIRGGFCAVIFAAGMIWPGLRVSGRRWAERSPRTFLLASAVLVGLFTVSSLWPLNRVEWGLIDDHEILMETNRPGGFTFANFVDKLQHHRELGGWAQPKDNISRFRPGYYLFRYLETWLWQGNAHAWGRTRIVLAGFSLWFLFLIVNRWADPLFSAAFCVSVTTFPCWPDVWRYLGRGEIYSAFGMGLCLWGFALLWGNPASPPRLSSLQRYGSWLAMFAGFLIAFGCKENFIFLIVPMLMVYGRDLWKKVPVTMLGHVTILLSLAFIGVIAWVLKFKLSLAGNLDVYGRSTDSGHRISFLVPGLKSFFLSSQGLGLMGFSVAVLAGSFWLIKRGAGSRREFRRIVWDVLAAVGFSAALYVFQFVFYVGGLENRYRFPAEFCWFFAAAAIAYAVTTSSRLRSLRLYSWKKMIWRGVLILALGPVVVFGPHRLAQETKIRVDQTQRFEQFLSRFAVVCRHDAERPVVIEASRIFAYEPTYAMPIILKRFGVTNPLYLWYSSENDPTKAESRHLSESLMQELTAVSREGRFDYRPWPKDVKAVLSNPLVISLDADQGVTAGEWHGRAPW